MVEKETRYYEDNEWLYTLTTVLQDTSIELEDSADEEDQEVELSEDDDEEESVDSELLAQNLEDYFLFDEGTWWQQEITVESLVAENSTETQTSLKIQVDCEDTVADTCFAIEDETGATEMYLLDNVMYAHIINGKKLSEDYVGFDLNG